MQYFTVLLTPLLVEMDKEWEDLTDDDFIEMDALAAGAPGREPRHGRSPGGERAAAVPYMASSTLTTWHEFPNPAPIDVYLCLRK